MLKNSDYKKMQTKFKLFENKEQSVYFHIPYGIVWRCRAGSGNLQKAGDWYIDDKEWIPLKIAIGS